MIEAARGGVTTCGVLLLMLLTSVINVEAPATSSGRIKQLDEDYSLLLNFSGFFYGVRESHRGYTHVFEPLMFKWYLTPEEAVEVVCLDSEYVTYQRVKSAPRITMKYDKGRAMLSTVTQTYETIRDPRTERNDIFVCGAKLYRHANVDTVVNRSLIATLGPKRCVRTKCLDNTLDVTPAKPQKYRFAIIDPPTGSRIVHDVERIIEEISSTVGINNLILIHKSMEAELTAKGALSGFKQLREDEYNYPCDDDHLWYTNVDSFPYAKPIGKYFGTAVHIPSLNDYDVRAPASFKKPRATLLYPQERFDQQPPQWQHQPRYREPVHHRSLYQEESPPPYAAELPQGHTRFPASRRIVTGRVVPDGQSS
eukprot:Lankesteria_metandrocarpae@DN3369_c0_g1_i1.p1